jgi:cystathionine gamma-synthase
MINKIQTNAIHTGRPHGQLGEPIASNLTFASSFHTSPGVTDDDLSGEPLPFYTRWGNPTVRLLERRMAALEAAEDGLCFASGMGAVAAFFLSLLHSGNHLIISDICYVGGAELVHDMLSKLIIAVSSVDTSDLIAVRSAIRSSTRLIYAETPANPILKLADITSLAAIARGAKIELAIESTLATPIVTRPISLGASFVVHSLTKYACRHDDTLGGIILGQSHRLAEIRRASLIHVGAVMHRFAAWLIERSSHTLPQRMRSHQEGAIALARYLTEHERVKLVLYPGLSSHPQHQLATTQMANFSGMIAVQIKDGKTMAGQIAERVRLFAYTVSLGKSHSNICYYPTGEVARKSFRLSEPALAIYRHYASDGIFRISVGLEHPDDLISDLEQALS